MTQYTLSPIIMEVEKGGLEDDFSIFSPRGPFSTSMIMGARVFCKRVGSLGGTADPPTQSVVVSHGAVPGVHFHGCHLGRYVLMNI